MLVPQKFSPVVTSDKPFVQPGLATQSSDLPATSSGTMPVAHLTGPVRQATASKKSSSSDRLEVSDTGLVVQSATIKTVPRGPQWLSG